MTDREALVRAICVAPDDDLPRLVFADWLDEHGEPDRAEFVRVQVEVARLEAVLAKPFEDQDLCESVSANWCPVCGDCICPSPEDEKCHPACPLHAPTSRHAGDDSLRSVVADLRGREAELWRVLGDGFDFGPLQSRLPWERGIDREDGVIVIDRGFGRSIRLPLAAFLGGGCGHDGCDMMGRLDLTGEVCPRCSGTGRTLGVAGPLFRSHPVERVTLTDKWPYWNGSGYCYYRDDRSHPGMVVPDSAVLPSYLFVPTADGYRLHSADSPEKADAWLSERCVRYGRQLAGLPPLPCAKLCRSSAGWV